MTDNDRYDYPELMHKHCLLHATRPRFHEVVGYSMTLSVLGLFVGLAVVLVLSAASPRLLQIDNLTNCVIGLGILSGWVCGFLHGYRRYYRALSEWMRETDEIEEKLLMKAGMGEE